MKFQLSDYSVDLRVSLIILRCNADVSVVQNLTLTTHVICNMFL